MTLYISKNGQRLGPYTVADAQNLVAAGTVKAGDWTWYEGLTTWIPLKQVPGISLAQTPAERPVLVWIICILVVINTAYSLFSWAMLMTMTTTDTTTVPPTQHHMITSVSYFQIGTIFLKLGLNVIWAVLFFMLKRKSFYLFLGTLGLSATLLIYNAIATDWFRVAGLYVQITTGVMWTINLAILYYNWHLFRKGILH